MAMTAEAAALTTAHRAEQTKNGALVAYVVAQLWLRSIDTDDISGSAAKLVARLIPMLRQRRTTSATLARTYYTRFRDLEVAGSDGFELPQLTQMNVMALETSLRVMGEVRLKGKLGSLPPDVVGLDSFTRAAVEETARDFSAAATRHVMNGGRDEIQSALQADRVALGYIRVTDSDPCFFCAMLASRGPVYDDESFDESDPRFIGPGEHKVHDHCACSTEPVYDRRTAWPGVAREAEKGWIQLSKDLGRVPTIQDWRHYWSDRKA